jgi:hypothetical protein
VQELTWSPTDCSNSSEELRSEIQGRSKSYEVHHVAWDILNGDALIL